MRQVEFPGVEELGIPGMMRRPQPYEANLEEQLGELLRRKRIEEMTKVHSVARGGTLIQDGREIAKGQPFPEPSPIGLVNRDARGQETTDYVRPADATGRQTVRQPLPRQPRGSTTVNVTSPEDRATIRDAIIAGTRSANLNGIASATRAPLEAELLRAGFNIKRAEADERAIQQNTTALNTAGFAAARTAAGEITEALTDLKRINDEWDRSSGPFSWASIALAKRKGGEAGKAAIEAEEAIKAIVPRLTALRGINGSAPTNQALLDAQKVLESTQSKDDMSRAINRLLREVGYRVRSITQLEAVMPPAPAAEAAFDYDLKTGQLVPRK
jgi:hypothetical protein